MKYHLPARSVTGMPESSRWGGGVSNWGRTISHVLAGSTDSHRCTFLAASYETLHQYLGKSSFSVRGGSLDQSQKEIQETRKVRHSRVGQEIPTAPF
jgi:hypothetical protein